MDSRYRFMTLGIPWTQSMPSRDVNAATRLAEASWRRDNSFYIDVCRIGLIPLYLSESALRVCPAC